jgi:hypothetical protein
MHVIRTNEPPPDNLDIVFLAVEPFTLWVCSDADPLPVAAGTLIAFDQLAFRESDTLTDAVDELVSRGKLELIRAGVLN